MVNIPAASSACHVGRGAVADHGRLVGRAAQPFDGDPEERRLRLADADRPDSARYSDRLGQRSAARVELIRAPPGTSRPC